MLYSTLVIQSPDRTMKKMSQFITDYIPNMGFANASNNETIFIYPYFSLVSIKIMGLWYTFLVKISLNA